MKGFCILLDFGSGQRHQVVTSFQSSPCCWCGKCSPSPEPKHVVMVVSAGRQLPAAVGRAAAISRHRCQLLAGAVESFAFGAEGEAGVLCPCSSGQSCTPKASLWSPLLMAGVHTSFPSMFEEQEKINASSSSVFLEYLQASGALASLRIEDSSEVTGGEVKSADGFVMTRDPAEPREATQKHHKFQRNQKSKHLPAFSFDLKIHRNCSAS